jgi:DNA modification methylase
MEEVFNNKTVLKSIDYDQGVIIKNLITLHVPDGVIDCDITYSKGNFYRKTGITEPIYKFDKYPQTIDSIEINDKIPLEDNTLNSIMFDPPFVIGGNKKVHDYDEGSCIIGKRFEQYKNFNELIDSYKMWIGEIYRVLKDNGTFIIKCQDQVSSGKQHLIHVFVINEAIKVGFYPKDMAILLAKNRIISPKHSNQKHLRKYNSYFLVFKKESFKNFYF